MRASGLAHSRCPTARHHQCFFHVKVTHRRRPAWMSRLPAHPSCSCGPYHFYLPASEIPTAILTPWREENKSVSVTQCAARGGGRGQGSDSSRESWPERPPAFTVPHSPVCSRYLMLTSSTGKKAAVAPYSGHMLAIVARSAMDSWATPGPKNSTNLPTTPTWRRCWVAEQRRPRGDRPHLKCSTVALQFSWTNLVSKHKLEARSLYFWWLLRNRTYKSDAN